MNMRTSRLLPLVAAFALAALLAPWATASESDHLRLEPAPAHRLDNESLQRGARTFINYCLNCHSAKYMRYNRLTDLGLTEAQISEFLLFGNAKIGDTMSVVMPVKDAKAWFGTVPPDLSVEARVRGVDWLYNYLLTFYRDDATPTGWNNLVFPGVAMPHVLWQLQGVNRLEVKEFDDHEKALAGAVSASAIAKITPGPNHKVEVRTLVMETPGTMKPEQYREVVADLVNFLDYMSEPAKTKRINTGLVVLLFLGVLFLFAYWSKREYWKDVH